MNSDPTRTSGRSAAGIDDISFRILQVLRDHGRISIAALAQEVGVSRSNAYARVEALTDAGVITGYAAQIDPVRAGLGVCTLVFVTVHPQRLPEFLEEISGIPDVESAKITTGEHDVMLLTRGADVEGVHSFVVGVVAALPQVKSVETVLVLDEVFDRGRLLPPDLGDHQQVAAERGLLRYTRTNPDRPSSID
ncbi:MULTISPECIES: Lrp/AsnC family transcriptional regulator [Brachybacterium]|uniref:Lrp/AsnC family transcriptional regulator n=1 Tax=Brachybacterium TaxID=43668 RepID=UPI000BB91DD5|nr:MULTISPECIES: Lrp/AsnC family transcriptional regulator [Brachybacterium]MDN5599811.1 Lrp/AsnC family transcriptional regulator [Brachybacterium sp.]MDN6330796.1 Lrp/AsnC family transcriptional regulator [Brachybacterium sp.]PCC34028.1 Fis family transcriptional regulator [Brachybacterium alimentarium]RCS63889.1 Lrp/AsnC family transcriptional regulator [Brachybacterium alimentarium]RCS85575.1 Lrp/AsnC family transcriptional regulator [Brachybacterium alimentarium]